MKALDYIRARVSLTDSDIYDYHNLFFLTEYLPLFYYYLHLYSTSLYFSYQSTDLLHIGTLTFGYFLALY